MSWSSRITGHADRDPRELAAHPANWRVHHGAQRRKLRAMLETVGVVQRVLVNQRTDTILDGHLRVELAIEDDLATVPVDYVDVSPRDEMLILATLDSSKALAIPDIATLDQVKHELVALDPLFAALAGIRVAPGDETLEVDPDVTEITATHDELAHRVVRINVAADELTHAIDVLDDVMLVAGVESHEHALLWLLERYT